MSHNSKKKESLIAFLCLSSMVMVTDFIAFYVVNKLHGLAVGAFIHVMLVGSLLALVLYRIYKRKNYRFSMLLLIMVSATGPFGAGVCMLASLGYLYSSGKFTPPHEWIEELLAHEDLEYENNLHERISLGLDDVSTKSGVEPFQDVFHSGTMLQKQLAIAKITRYFQPQLAQLLLDAAQDPNAAVRVQAAAALAKLEGNFTKRCMELEKGQNGIPPDDKSWFALAMLYEDYANAGLVDEHSIESLRSKAIKIYESYLTFNRDDEAQIHLAKIYLKNNQAEKAYKILLSAMESGGRVTQDALSLYTETLFWLKKFGDIRLLARNYMNEMPEAGEESKYEIGIDEAMNFWKVDFSNAKSTQFILEKNYAT